MASGGLLCWTPRDLTCAASERSADHLAVVSIYSRTEIRNPAASLLRCSQVRIRAQAIVQYH